MYQLPEINHYLGEEFVIKLNSELPDIKFNIKQLTLIDLEIFFVFLHLKEFSLKIFETFL